MGLLAFYVFRGLCCLVCLVAFYLAVPKMLFRDHLFACLGTALGLNPAGDPVFRNHAPPCSTRPFHGPSSLLCLLWLVLPCLPCSFVAVPMMLFRDHLFACRGTALGLNPAGDPVFRNHAPPCSTRSFHGPSSLLCLLWLVLPCLPCSLVFSSSEDAILRSSLRLPLGLNPAGDPVFWNHAPPCSTWLFHGPSSLLCLLWLAFPCLPSSLVFSGSEDAISRPSLRLPWP